MLSSNAETPTDTRKPPPVMRRSFRVKKVLSALSALSVSACAVSDDDAETSIVAAIHAARIVPFFMTQGRRRNRTEPELLPSQSSYNAGRARRVLHMTLVGGASPSRGRRFVSRIP